MDELMVIWDRINQALAAGPNLPDKQLSACDIYLQVPAIHRMLSQHDAAA